MTNTLRQILNNSEDMLQDKLTPDNISLHAARAATAAALATDGILTLDEATQYLTQV